MILGNCGCSDWKWLLYYQFWCSDNSVKWNYILPYLFTLFIWLNSILNYKIMSIFIKSLLIFEWFISYLLLLMWIQESPIIDFYPEDFKIDLNGKKYAWQGVALLPFVDENRLKQALLPLHNSLTADESKPFFQFSCHLNFDLKSIWCDLFTVDNSIQLVNEFI